MKEKVILAGGTGFIGQYFEEKLKQLGYDVHIISRSPRHISWNDSAAIIEALEDSAMLINLAGKSVDCRYNDKNKEEILRSRVETTKRLGEAILACRIPPRLWINSSTATIYRHAEDRPMTELDGEIGTGFSVDVAKAWEDAFFSFDLSQTRQAALRISIVLGKHGGVMTPYRNLVKFGLGGVQGSGNQKFSWIHIDDLFRIVLFIKENEGVSGVFNCAAPHPVTNREFMHQLRTAMNVRVGLPSPKWLLELGAFIIRTETELIVKSRWVIPQRLEQQGFRFQFDQVNKALADLCAH